MKRIIALLLMLVLCIGVFSGCSSFGNGTKQYKDKVKGKVRQETDAIKVGDHTLNAVELNYFYVDTVSNFKSSNSAYIMYMLDTTAPLDKQYNDAERKVTWADYFLEKTQNTIKSTYALYDEAIKNDHKLTDEEQANLETTIDTVNTFANNYGYRSFNDFLAWGYGNGASEESFRQYMNVCALADSYYNKYSGDLEFSDAQVEDYQKNTPFVYNSYTFDSYYLSASSFREGGVKNDDGSISYSEVQIAAAIKKAEEVANELAAGKYENVAAFDKAIAALEINKDSKTAAATKNEDTLYSKVNSLFRYWVAGYELKEGVKEADAKFPDDYNKVNDGKGRTEGEMYVVPYTSGSGDSKTVIGYYVIRFESETKNDFALRDVRHILVAFEGGTTDSSGKKTYSDAEKAKAKTEAEKLLAQWEAGAKTEDSFAELANKESDDGNGITGGLYENVYPGQMIDAFDAWCYDDSRKAGDYGIIETEYGYHVMYFVGDCDENYRSYMIREDLHNEQMTQWHEQLVNEISFELLSQEYLLPVVSYCSSFQWSYSVNYGGNVGGVGPDGTYQGITVTPISTYEKTWLNGLIGVKYEFKPLP